MKYLVMTTGVRDISDIQEKLPELESYLGGVNTCDNYYEMCKIAVESKQDLLAMEDDIKLCSNFKEEIDKAITKYPDMVINFFDGYDKPFEKSTVSFGGNFIWCQCVYIPLYVCKLFVKMYKTLKYKYQIYSNTNSQDQFFGMFLIHSNLDYVNYYPCLVQHKKLESLIDSSRSINRQTKYFIEDL